VHPKAEHAFATPDGQATSRSESAAAYWAERLDTTNWLELVPGGLPGNPQLSEGDEVKGHFGQGSPFESRTVVSSAAHPELLTLHVWLSIENPDGVFAPPQSSVGRRPRPLTLPRALPDHSAEQYVSTTTGPSSATRTRPSLMRTRPRSRERTDGQGGPQAR
jgi:hypothetical protein